MLSRVGQAGGHRTFLCYVASSEALQLLDLHRQADPGCLYLQGHLRILCVLADNYQSGADGPGRLLEWFYPILQCYEVHQSLFLARLMIYNGRDTYTGSKG